MYAIFSSRTDVEIKLKHTLDEALKERKMMKLWLGDAEVQIAEVATHLIDPQIIESHDESVKYMKRNKSSSIESSVEIITGK